jgi:hypothetical protein
MARRSPGGGGRGAAISAHPAVRAAKRAWPVLIAAYRRWDQLTPAQQERYRRMASEYTRRGRETLGRRRRR